MLQCHNLCVYFTIGFCRLLHLSMDQKCNIATRELDELREEIQREQEEAEINYDNLRVSGWRNTAPNTAKCIHT